MLITSRVVTGPIAWLALAALPWSPMAAQGLLGPPTAVGAKGVAPVATSTSGAVATPATQPSAAAAPFSATATTPRTLKVSKGTGILPNDFGQVWREYDIAPYTQQLAETEKPQQAIVDWVLRETGTEAWFGDPLGILSATPTTLRVYHTPAIQERVQAIVERFVRGDAEVKPLGIRLMTVSSPNWRTRAISLVKPVEVKSPGVEAWLLSRENATLFYEQLKTRGDFREHSAPRIEIANGQARTLSRKQPRKYVRSVQLKREFPFYDLIPGQFEEGYSLKISPLASLDGQMMEVTVECQVDQIEKLLPLAMDVPTGNESQRVQIQVPQIAGWRLSERFRWPTQEVLLLSCGVVATPAPAEPGPLALLGSLGSLGATSQRADALLLIENHPAEATGLAQSARIVAPTPTRLPK